MKFSSLTMISILLLSSYIFSANRVTYGTYEGILKKVTPSGGSAEKKLVTLTDDQAADLKKMQDDFNENFYDEYEKELYDARFKGGKKFYIHVLKNSSGAIHSYLIRMDLELEEYDSPHPYVYQISPDKKSVMLVDVLFFEDEYAEKTKEKGANFYPQFKGKAIGSLKLGSNIDAITEATETAAMTIHGAKLAKYILQKL